MMATGLRGKSRRLQKLKEVHRHLDNELIKEYNRHSDVQNMKVEKLKLKDEIVKLEKEVTDGKLL